MCRIFTPSLKYVLKYTSGRVRRKRVVEWLWKVERRRREGPGPVFQSWNRRTGTVCERHWWRNRRGFVVLLPFPCFITPQSCTSTNSQSRGGWSLFSGFRREPQCPRTTWRKVGVRRYQRRRHTGLPTRNSIPSFCFSPQRRVCQTMSLQGKGWGVLSCTVEENLKEEKQ